MEEELVQLLEDLCALHNRALTLGIDLSKFSHAAAQAINSKHTEVQKADLERIMTAFRKPQSTAVQ